MVKDVNMIQITTHVSIQVFHQMDVMLLELIQSHVIRTQEDIVDGILCLTIVMKIKLKYLNWDAKIISIKICVFLLLKNLVFGMIQNLNA